MNSVLLVTIDCLRADHVGCYGYERDTTPNLDELAQTGTAYKHSFANSPGTRWSMQSLLSGLWSYQVEGDGLPQPPPPNLASWFKNQGYQTAAFHNNGYLSRDYGYDQGFDTFVSVENFPEDPESPNKSDPQTYRQDYTDQELCTEAIDWLQKRRDASEPYFLWVHLMDAHTPYSRWDKHLGEFTDPDQVPHVIDPGEHGDITVGKQPPQFVIDTYDACIRSADEQFGRLLNNIEAGTVVAATGDHGEEFGVFNTFHKHSLYSSMTQVPIIIKAPNFPGGLQEKPPAQHLDLPTTIVRSAGGAEPEAWASEPLQKQQKNASRPIFFQVDEAQFGVRVGEWKLLHTPDSGWELFQSVYGKSEETNLKDKHPDKFDRLKAKLDHFQQELEALPGYASADKQSEEISEETRESLENLGYL